MQNDLQARPLQQTIVLHNEGKDRLVPSSQRSFGLLGHLGSSVTPHTSETLHAVFRTVGNIIEQQIEQSEEKEKLQTHLRAIVEHPQISDLL